MSCAVFTILTKPPQCLKFDFIYNLSAPIPTVRYTVRINFILQTVIAKWFCICMTMIITQEVSTTAG